MFGRRDRLPCILAKRGIVDKGLPIAVGDGLSHHIVEPHRPVIWLSPVLEARRAEIVNHVTRPGDEHPLVAEVPQSAAEFVVEAGRLCPIDAELHDGHIGVRENVAQHRPCPVVQSPVLIPEHLDGREETSGAFRQSR